MEFKVRKNNGKLEEFNIDKIKQAIQCAAKATKQDIPDSTISRIANEIKSNFENQKDVSIVKVEQISELVEEKLMGSNYKDSARCYIRYRYDKEKERLYNTEVAKLFRKKLAGEADVIENQNANQDEHSFSGRINEASRVYLKDDALNNRMSKMARDNHNNNMIYIHDLDSYSAGLHNCLSIPFDELLRSGFEVRNGDTRHPKSIGAAIQLIITIMQVQSIEQFGGVSATHLDWTLVPYIRHSFYKFYLDGLKYIRHKQVTKIKDEAKIENTSIEDTKFYNDEECRLYALDLVTRELHQQFESFFHEANTLGSRSGGQLPFSSINYGTCTLKEGQLCIDAILDACMDGMGKLHRTYIFPCGIWQYMKGVNDKPGTPNYYLFQKALKSTALRIYPNYVNCEWSVDKAGLARDRKFKEDYINSLSKEDYNKLVKALEENPEIAKKLSLEIVEE